MFLTTLLTVSAIAVVMWAFEASSLSNPAKILLVGVILIVIASWSRRWRRIKGKA